MQHLEHVAELTDQLFQGVGMGQLVLLQPGLGDVFELAHHLDEDLCHIVERLLQLRLDEQHRQGVPLGRLE